MNQKLLTDIELDVQELKCLMKSFDSDHTSTLRELLKRSIIQMQGRLEQLKGELGEVQISESVACPAQGVEEEIGKEEIVLEEGVEPNEEQVAVQQPVAEELIVSENAVLPELEKNSFLIVEETGTTESKDAFSENNVKEEPVILGESLNLYTGGLRHFISLNDSFRFSRNLFGGDNELMNRVIEQISAMSSYKAAVAFVFSKINATDEDETFNDFLELLKKYFNQSL